MTSLEDELRDRLHIRRLEKVSTSGAGGGCISAARCYSTEKGDKIFVKTNGGLHAMAMFQGEMESLQQINATKTIRAPKPLAVIHDYDESHCSAIAMEYLDIAPLTDGCAQSLGENLAKLHSYNEKLMRYNERAARWIGGVPPSSKAVIESRKKDCDQDASGSSDGSDEEENQFSKHSMRVQASGVSRSKQDVLYESKFVPEPDTELVEQFGFPVPTSCGSIPQRNDWTDDWIAFYSRQRLDKTIRSLLSDHGDRELLQRWSHLQLKIDKFFTDYEPKGEGKIVPALLHGDLWSGNVAQLSDGSEAVIYDPSAFYGHNEYEFGIARMFGGISKQFEKHYFELMPKKKLFEKRNKLYQLFHHLNHWDHFGSGYRSSSLRILGDLNAAV